MKRVIIIIGFLLLTSSTLAGVAWATTPSGVTSTTPGRISLGPPRDISWLQALLERSDGHGRPGTGS